MNTTLAILGAVTGLGALVNSLIGTFTNRANGRAVRALEEGKLDLSVAELGHDILLDLITTLRVEVQDCHQERDEFRAILVENDLLTK